MILGGDGQTLPSQVNQFEKKMWLLIIIKNQFGNANTHQLLHFNRMDYRINNNCRSLKCISRSQLACKRFFWVLKMLLRSFIPNNFDVYWNIDCKHHTKSNLSIENNHISRGRTSTKPNWNLWFIHLMMKDMKKKGVEIKWISKKRHFIWKFRFQKHFPFKNQSSTSFRFRSNYTESNIK